MAFKVSGYTSGVVASFSIRQPMTRASTALSCGALFSGVLSGASWVPDGSLVDGSMSLRVVGY
jgi:hypothetical protein